MSRTTGTSRRRYPFRFYILSLILSGIPLGLAVLFWLFALVVALAHSGWLVFYGSVVFLYVLSAIMLPCGAAGIVLAIIAFLRHEVRFRCGLGFIAAFLTIALGALLASQTF